jgi:hypothetical protein
VIAPFLLTNSAAALRGGYDLGADFEASSCKFRKNFTTSRHRRGNFSSGSIAGINDYDQ